MLHTKQPSDLLQDLFQTEQLIEAKVENKSCSRSEVCFVCSMNYCCDHDVRSNKSHVSSQCFLILIAKINP